MAAIPDNQPLAVWLESVRIPWPLRHTILNNTAATYMRPNYRGGSLFPASFAPGDGLEFQVPASGGSVNEARNAREFAEELSSSDYASTASLSTTVSSGDLWKGYGDQCTRCGRAWKWDCPICQVCRDADVSSMACGSIILPYGSMLVPRVRWHTIAASGAMLSIGT